MMNLPIARVRSFLRNHPLAFPRILIPAWSAVVALSLVIVLGWPGDHGQGVGAVAPAGHRVAAGVGHGVVWGLGIGGILWAWRRRKGAPGRRGRAEAGLHPPTAHDALTGPPDRTLLLDRLSRCLGRSRRSGRQTAVLHLALDGFRAIRDTLGHEAGDRVLREVASRMATVVREADTMARTRGDQFVVVLDDLPAAHVAARVANEVIEAIGNPIALAEEDVVVDACVGIAFFPNDATAPETLLHAAGAAMHELRSLGMTGFSCAGDGAWASISRQFPANEGRVRHYG